MQEIPEERDHPEEECGVFGVVAPGHEVARITFFGLHAHGRVPVMLNFTAGEANLKAAFAGESQANRKYTNFAKKADDEGYPQVAKLFRAAAVAEATHAANHLRALAEIKSTAENLQAAIGGENYEVVSMYPEFIKAAEAGRTGEPGQYRDFVLPPPPVLQ